jgi:dTDP-4-amino-4,6-dideoxygalactose transaminase
MQQKILLPLRWMITLSDPEKAKYLRILATMDLQIQHGTDMGEVPLIVLRVNTAGFKYGMSNISASIGVEQLKKLSSLIIID